MTFIDEIERRGERRGERKAQVRVLLQQMSARFGSVPPEVSARIQAAKRSVLDQWALRVLTANTPEEVVAAGELKTAQVKLSRRQPATRKRT